MPRRKTRTTGSSRRTAVLLAAATAALFLLGEALLLSRSDSGQVALARIPVLGDPNRAAQVVSKQLRQGMRVLEIPDDSLTMDVDEKGTPGMVWRLGLARSASLLRANFVLTRYLEKRGARVFSGRERPGPSGETILTMVVGPPGRPTHRLLLVRGGYAEGEEVTRHSLVAVVFYGFGDDAGFASEFFAIPAMFAVALPPGGKSGDPLIRAAHGRGREIVLHLPLEPINYPQINPGPGTVLVTMSPTRIAGLVHRYIEQSRPLLGVANHMGSLATQDVTVMTAIFRELRRNQLPFVHVAPAAGAVCKDLAADLGVAYNEPDAIVDAETRASEDQALERRWSALLEEARGRERMVVWMRATPLTRRWLMPALKGKLPPGVHIVPLSAVIKRPMAL